MAKEPENKPTTPIQKLLMTFITLIFLLLLVSLSVSISPQPASEQSGAENVSRQGCLEAGGVWNASNETCTGTEISTSTEEVGWPETVNVSVGQTVGTGGLSITLEEIISDSRCPEGVFCITAGDVTMALIFSANEQERSVTLSSAGDSFEFSSYTVSIDTVEPAATRSGISDEEYTVSFVVDQLDG